MTDRMQVVIPMAGSGDRFLRAGYAAPKPLLDIAGKPLIERLLTKFPAEWRFVFIVNEDQLQKTSLAEVLRALRPHAEIAAIQTHKKGPVFTLLQGASVIADDMPTLVNYCDFSFSWDVGDFTDFVSARKADGAILCYRGFHPHCLGNTLYAYCRETEGRVLEVREKGHFTPDRLQEYASSGTYYFASGGLLKQYGRIALEKGLSINGEYYVSVVYNPMIDDGKRIFVHEIPFMLQWGTPEDLEDYLYWHRLFETWNSQVQRPAEGSLRLVMPMAGLGSRFQNFQCPKPLIPVLGRPMYRTAMSFLPPSKKKPVLVVRTELEEAVRSSGEAEIIALEKPTQGQADSTLAALNAVDPEDPVLVSACDHGFLWDEAAWSSLLERKPDVVVFGQRGYPGARRTPASYSYFETDPEGNIRRVSVKKPLTAQPQRELLLIGTFYFARAAGLRDLILELQARDLRVNQERYLDSVVGIALERGMRVIGFECQGYLNWGSPDALQEFSYWYRYFRRTTP